MSPKTISMAFVGFVLVAFCFIAVFFDGQGVTSRRNLWWGGLDITGARCSTCFKEDTIGPVSTGTKWKSLSGLALPEVIFGVSNIASQTAEQQDAEKQWLGAVMRTAAQGGKIANWVLEQYLKSKGGSQAEKSWDNFDRPTHTRPHNNVDNWVRQSGFRRLGGKANVEGGWSQQNGAYVKGGIEFTWKEITDVETQLIEEVMQYATNAIRHLMSKGSATDVEKSWDNFDRPTHTRPHNNVDNWVRQSGFRRLGALSSLGDRLAQLVEIFSDDLRAAAAAMRTLAQHKAQVMDAEKSWDNFDRPSHTRPHNNVDNWVRQSGF